MGAGLHYPPLKPGKLFSYPYLSLCWAPISKWRDNNIFSADEIWQLQANRLGIAATHSKLNFNSFDSFNNGRLDRYHMKTGSRNHFCAEPRIRVSQIYLLQPTRSSSLAEIATVATKLRFPADLAIVG